MKLILRSRGLGKTTELIKKSAKLLKEGCRNFIVVSTQNEAVRVAEVARDLNLNIPFPLTFNEFMTGQYHNVSVLLIDQADHLIQEISRVPIVWATMDYDLDDDIKAYEFDEKAQGKFIEDFYLDEIPKCKTRALATITKVG